MRTSRDARTVRGYLVLAAVVLLSLILLASSLSTFSELNRMKTVYLRDQAATLAALLETLPPEQLASGVPADLVEDQHALVDLKIFDPGKNAPESAALEPLWSGEELFHTEELTQKGEKLFRAYIPFHSQLHLRIARIDLDAASADFLIHHARNNLLIASVSGLVLVLLSITFVWEMRRRALLERRQLELEQLARLGEMSATLAHEIRNPLGTIKGFAQLVSEKAAGLADLVEPILDEVRRLETLVNNLLLYGRPPSPTQRVTDWDALAHELELYARPIRLVWNATSWQIPADPDLLKEALLNLIRNAIEALGDSADGEVRLTAKQTDTGLAILVEDNGPGIPESARGKLFQPFFTTKAFGTGLGLSITRKLVESLGGSLDLRNVAPHGTRAELIFPKIETTAWKKS